MGTTSLYKKLKKNFKSKLTNANGKVDFLTDLMKMNFESFKEWLVKSDRKAVINNLDSFDRNKILRALLYVQPDLVENSNTHSNYFQGETDHICGIRNEYGHQTEMEIGDNHNPDRCKHIRIELSKHIENLNSINS